MDDEKWRKASTRFLRFDGADEVRRGSIAEEVHRSHAAAENERRHQPQPTAGEQAFCALFTESPHSRVAATDLAENDQYKWEMRAFGWKQDAREEASVTREVQAARERGHRGKPRKATSWEGYEELTEGGGLRGSQRSPVPLECDGFGCRKMSTSWPGSFGPFFDPNRGPH